MRIRLAIREFRAKMKAALLQHKVIELGSPYHVSAFVVPLPPFDRWNEKGKAAARRTVRAAYKEMLAAIDDGNYRPVEHL